jgi:hypothetical protein
MEYLEHTMLETEFSQIDGKDYLEYRFENAFFNSDDLFDMYEINDGELSHWDAYYDDTYQTFLSQPVYGDGFVRWNAHPDSPSVVADRTVRFYRISSR